MALCRSLEHDAEMGLTAEQQNGEAKRRKDLDGGAGNVWFGSCVVHMCTYGRSGHLTINRCRSTRGWRVGYCNRVLRQPDPTRPRLAGSLLRYFIVTCWGVRCWSMDDGALTSAAGRRDFYFYFYFYFFVNPNYRAKMTIYVTRSIGCGDLHTGQEIGCYCPTSCWDSGSRLLTLFRRECWHPSSSGRPSRYAP